MLQDLHVLHCFCCVQILRDDLQMTVDKLFNLQVDAIGNVAFVNEIGETDCSKLLSSLDTLHKHYRKPLVMLP